MVTSLVVVMLISFVIFCFFFFLHLCSFAHFKCLVIFVHVCHMRSCLLLCSGLPCFTVSSVLADVVCHKFEFVFFSKDEHFQDFLRVAL